MPGKYIKIGDTLTCLCNIPMAKRTGQREFSLFKYYRNIKVKVKIEQGLGVSKICCETCGYKYTTIRFADGAGVRDTLNISKT